MRAIYLLIVKTFSLHFFMYGFVSLRLVCDWQRDRKAWQYIMRNIATTTNASIGETFGHHRENTTQIFIRFVSLFACVCFFFFLSWPSVYFPFFASMSYILETTMFEKKFDCIVSCECSVYECVSLCLGRTLQMSIPKTLTLANLYVRNQT